MSNTVISNIILRILIDSIETDFTDKLITTFSLCFEKDVKKIEFIFKKNMSRRKQTSLSFVQ